MIVEINRRPFVVGLRDDAYSILIVTDGLPFH